MYKNGIEFFKKPFQASKCLTFYRIVISTIKTVFKDAKSLFTSLVVAIRILLNAITYVSKHGLIHFNLQLKLN
jgi:hypothetical protein